MEVRAYTQKNCGSLSATVNYGAPVTRHCVVISEKLLNSTSSCCFRDIGLQAYWGHDFDLSGSRYVIGQVTIGFDMGDFRLVVIWIGTESQ